MLELNVDRGHCKCFVTGCPQPPWHCLVHSRLEHLLSHLDSLLHSDLDLLLPSPQLGLISSHLGLLVGPCPNVVWPMVK